MAPASLLSRTMGSRVLRTLVCAAVLICVLTIVVTPQLDLEPTALRAWRIAFLLLLQLTDLLVVIAARLRPYRPMLEMFPADEAAQRPGSRLAVTCCLLC
jgi:hypothetical protein